MTIWSESLHLASVIDQPIRLILDLLIIQLIDASQDLCLAFTISFEEWRLYIVCLYPLCILAIGIYTTATSNIDREFIDVYTQLKKQRQQAAETHIGAFTHHK